MLYVSTYSRQYMAVNSNGKLHRPLLRSSPLVSGNAYDFQHCLSVLLHLLPIHRFHARYEQEGRYPRKRELYSRLAQVLDTETSYLLTEDEEFVSQASDKYGNRGKLQAEKLVAELSGMFAGGELSDSDKDAVMIALQKAYFDCKEDNKKYTPKKYRKK